MWQLLCMQTRLSKFLNTIFKYTTIFLLFFVWLNFYLKNFILSIFISVLLSILIGLLLEFFSRKKQNILTLKKSEKKLIEECSFQFIFSEKKYHLNFYQMLLSKKYKVELMSDFLIVKNNDKCTLFIPIYQTSEIKSDDIIQSYLKAKELGINNIVITCKSYNEDALQYSKYVKDITFNLLDENLTFKHILKPLDTYPNFSIEKKKVDKLKYNEIKKSALNKRKSKSYLLSAILLVFSSFFTKYNLYYLITASLLFILALYSSFNTNYNIIEEENLF